MKNLKVRAKLIVSFGSIILFVLVLGFFSLRGIRNLGEVIEEYHSVSLPDTEKTLVLKGNLYAIRMELLLAVLSPDIATVNDALGAAEQEREKLLGTLDELNSSRSYDKVKLKEFETEFQNADAYFGALEGFSREVTLEGNSKAYTLFIEKYSPSFDRAAAVLDQLISQQSDAMDVYGKEADRTVYVAQSVVFFVLVGVLLLAYVVTVVISRSIRLPIYELEKAAIKLKNGELDMHIAYESRDELGVLSENMRGTMTTLHGYIEDIQLALNEIANGNFDIGEPRTPFLGAFQAMEDSIHLVVATMSETLEKISLASRQVFEASGQVSNGAQILAQGAAEQSNSLEQLSSTIEDISTQINQNASNSSSANQLARKATESITSSNTHMQELMLTMDDIHTNSAEISKIIKTIEDIAFQTNILALNAAVEAARAGAAGKGFAVVADEVRNLASRSAEAARSTTALIETTVASVNEGVSAAQITAKDLKGAVESVKETTAMIGEITKASSEQAEAITQVTKSIDMISSVVHTNSATSEQSAAASEELSGQANLLHELISYFKFKQRNYDENNF